MACQKSTEFFVTKLKLLWIKSNLQNFQLNKVFAWTIYSIIIYWVFIGKCYVLFCVYIYLTQPDKRVIVSSYHFCQQSTAAVWPDWAIYWTLGNFSKPLSTINLPKSPTFKGNFSKWVKIFNFSNEIIFGQLLQTFGNFFLVTLNSNNDQKMVRLVHTTLWICCYLRQKVAFLQRDRKLSNSAENTHCWGKHHCTAGLQFYKVALDCFTKYK